MPERIQRKRTKGWKMPEGAVYVGRPTKWGNPFKTAFYVQHQGLSDYCAHVLVASMFRAGAYGSYDSDIGRRDFSGYYEHFKGMRDHIEELRGKDLVCWCPLKDADGQPVPCHADVLLELANKGDD